MKRVRILLADDHTLFCSMLKDLLKPEYEVVGSVSDGRTLESCQVAPTRRGNCGYWNAVAQWSGRWTEIEASESSTKTDLPHSE
jgi:CheY-like chemotaxis protein